MFCVTCRHDTRTGSIYTQKNQKKGPRGPTEHPPCCACATIDHGGGKHGMGQLRHILRGIGAIEWGPYPAWKDAIFVAGEKKGASGSDRTPAMQSARLRPRPCNPAYHHTHHMKYSEVPQLSQVHILGLSLLEHRADPNGYHSSQFDREAEPHKGIPPLSTPAMQRKSGLPVRTPQETFEY